MVELLNHISNQIEHSQINWSIIASKIGIDGNDIVEIQKKPNATVQFVNAVTRKIWKNLFLYVGVEFINTAENVFEVTSTFSLGKILVECDNPSKAQEKCEFKVVEEISKRVSEWKMFGRILGLNESFLNQLEKDHQSYPERNNEIIRKFCSPLEPHQSWLLWRHYLEQFEDGINVIKEMETTYIDLLAQTPDNSAHIMKTEKQIYIGHSYASINNKVSTTMDNILL